MIDPQPDFRPAPLHADKIAPGLRRILAPNPSPMTFRGTNTYLLGETDIAVIDPGPASEDHLEAILSAIGPGQRITHILVSHAHLDHSPLARPLAERCDAPVLGFGGHDAGRSPQMQALAESGLAGGGEGVDAAFAPDRCLADQEVITGAGWELTALHLPGHMANHMGFAWGRALFSADLVMGWATSLVSPPDGDLTAFMASLARLQDQDWSVFYPGHGAPVDQPNARVADLVAHRLSRETAILAALEAGPADARRLAKAIYTETPDALMGAATRNVLAHLIDLTSKSKARFDEPLTEKSRFVRI